MSKAIEETLRKLEKTSIDDTKSSSSSSSPPPLPTSSKKKDEEATDTAVDPKANNTNKDSSTRGGDRQSRRVVQSMFGAPPGYNASMGVGGNSASRNNGWAATAAGAGAGTGRGGSRQRNSIMVPDQLQAAMLPQNNVPSAPLQEQAIRLTGAEYALMANMPNDAIPNAIVVKNINFEIKREELLQTMDDLDLPLPYAFNYHYENGMFRGLAFGNFRAAEEAARVIVALNGITLLGRPLKVEYKKALPGTAPPAHPDTVAMMTSLSATGATASGDGASQYHYDQPIPRPRRNQHNNNNNNNNNNGGSGGRPQSMIMYSSPMSTPGNYNHSQYKNQQSQQQKQQQQQQQQQQQRQQPRHSSSNDDAGSLIDLDDKDTRTLYDLVSQFRQEKAVSEVEFPPALNTKQRQTVMLIAERFGLNHETKGDANDRYIRVYKNLDTLLEGTEVKRRSMVSPNNSRYGSWGPQRSSSRPQSMFYSDTMSMNNNGMMSPPSQSHRMSMYQQTSSGFQQYDPSNRGRSYTAATNMGNYQQQQPFPRSSVSPVHSSTNNNYRRMSANYGGYPSRMYQQDSAVAPIRQPRGPDMERNFAARQQEERQAQRQMQLKVLQQNRQRRLSTSAETATNKDSNDEDIGGDRLPKIEKPASKAIPIVKPEEAKEEQAKEVAVVEEKK